jgi:hypothetical protein
MPLSFCLPFFYLVFLDKKEKMRCITYLYLTVIVRRLNMQLRKTIRKERKKTIHKETINKLTKIPKYFWIFLYLKRACLSKYQNEREIKYMKKIYGCVLPNTPLAKSSLSWMGLVQDPTYSFFIYWAQSSLSVQAGLDPAGSNPVTGPSQ